VAAGVDILIAEDSSTQALHLQHVLEENGYRTTVVANGIEALAAIERSKPSIVVSDIVMPGMDGYELCRRIKTDAARSDISVILLTSLSQPQVVIHALQCGADKFLTKPYEQKHLLSAVDSLCLNRGLEDRDEPDGALSISYRGETYSITSSRRQILTLLLATYETAMANNSELAEAQDELRDLNHELEKRVRRRTEALSVEITERIQTEESLVRERVMIDRIMDTSPAGILMVDRDGRFGFANRRAQEILGGAIDQSSDLTYDSPKWQIADFDGGPIPHADLPVSRVIASGEQVHGVRYAITCPDGRRVYLSVSGAPLFDDAGEVSEVVLTFDDVTEQRRNEETIRDTIEKLQQSVATTTRVIAQVVEARDPYTAGHQENVAALAVAIATEYGLGEDRMDGLRLAGKIHDIGKIFVPTELLVKPTPLAAAEMALIRQHAQSGYEIIKDIDYPWQVARMVREHHERFDGSGYPQGLAGDDQLVESRILAVADVVESMASRRPYRDALGIDLALAEIRDNGGVIYDPRVADACLRLFEEKGFRLG